MKMIAITQVRSEIGTPEKHRSVIKGLGLRKIGHKVIRQDTPEIRGMVNKIRHLVTVEEVDS